MARREAALVAPGGCVLKTGKEGPDSMDRSKTTRGALHGSHWGAFYPLLRDGRVVGIEPFERDGDPSAILDSIPGGLEHATRIRRPMLREGWQPGGKGNRQREGARFTEISWERALDLIAAELQRVKADYGNASIFGGSYGWSSAGRFHHARTQLRRFLSLFGGFTDQVTNYSFAAGMTILPHVLGSNQALLGPVTSWSSVVQHTKLLVAFGGMPLKNTQVQSGGCAEHVASEWADAIARAGVKVVNVSPVRADTADALSAQWLPINPNTDVALMLGLAHRIVTRGRHDKEFLARCCTGWERFQEYLLGRSDGLAKTPEWAAAICGIDAGTITALADAMAANRTMITMSYSLQRADHGEQPFWMAVALAAVLGQIGLPGGGVGFGYGADNGTANPTVRISTPTLPLPANPIDKFIPVARITDMLLHPGETIDFDGQRITYPDTRLIYWAGGNPYHHHQDLNRLMEAWQRPETIVVHEPWWTPTARRADIVLPATTTLERNDIQASSSDRFLVAMHKAIEPVGGSRNDHDIFLALASRLGFAPAFNEGLDETGWLKRMYGQVVENARPLGLNLPSFDEFWAQGYVEYPRLKEPYVLMAKFRADPTGQPLATPSGKIEIFSEKIAGFGYADCPGHPVWLEPAEWLGAPAARRFPLHLISNQPKTRLHSQLDMATTSTNSKLSGREPLAMNPGDAAARGLETGSIARIFNDRGACLAAVVVNPELRAGVVQISTGAWFDPEAVASGATRLERHGNPNVLTLDKGTSRLAQGPSAQTALVEIERFEGELPPIGAFEPPV
jgi:biotin/methionine sulfoxide reductase